MKPNTVFENLNDGDYAKIISNLKSGFVLIEREIQQGTKEAFTIKSTEGKINFTYYNNRKFMIQSSPTNTVYVSIIQDISKSLSIIPHEKEEIIPKEESELISEYYVGCDESGAGESFGSMFLGCAVIQKKNLESICDIIKGKNIRQLNEREITQILNAISGTYESNVKVYSPSEIDDGLKNVLLDRGYIDLIDSAIQNKSKISIVIDDYGIRYELEKYLKKINSENIVVIVKTKADEQYTACKLASLIARKARMENITHINSINTLVDDETKEMIMPGSGAASNENTERYLKEFRIRFPDAEFPPFVRKKWLNIVKINEKYPRRITGFSVHCNHCSSDLSRVDVMYDKKTGTTLCCSKCSNLISIENFRACFSKNMITLDTSTLISRIVSKDLNSSQYFKDNEFLLPTFVYEEMDTKQPDKKRGAQNEITTLREFEKNKIIRLRDIDTHQLAHGVPNDKKLLAVLDSLNSCVLTKDTIMATFAEIDHFVIFVKGM